MLFVWIKKKIRNMETIKNPDRNYLVKRGEKLAKSYEFALPFSSFDEWLFLSYSSNLPNHHSVKRVKNSLFNNGRNSKISPRQFYLVFVQPSFVNFVVVVKLVPPSILSLRTVDLSPTRSLPPQSCLFSLVRTSDPVLYDDDGELVQENRISGICQFPKGTEMFKWLKRAGKRTKVVEQLGSSDDEGLLFDDIFGEEKASFCGQNYEMSDFIVGEEESYGEGSSLRRLKINKKKMEQVVIICSSALNDKVPTTDDTNQTLNHQKQVQASKVNLDNSSEFELFFLANKYTTEKDDLIRQTDIPERMQMIEEIVGPPSLDKRSIEEETIWIHNQLVMNSYILFCKRRTEERSVEVSVLLNKIKKEDIMRFLELHHVEKFDVLFIAMYRKEQCLSLLDDFEQNEAENEDNDDVGKAGQLKWHKSREWLRCLNQWPSHNNGLYTVVRKSVLQMHQRKIYDKECLKIDNGEKYTLNKLLSGFNIICTIYNLCYLDSFDCGC
ncbi:hypothetical protein CXB51_015772 [Gossypium anomalum]|uniref:Uncharacterized protein n=1 Tax=Gossypium anomalum TaxID=47600 RepID=A0A8J5Z1L7_9ROSI|nr:hypothetical protein CXB51_015772 [Gossypium anomalum]